MPLSRREIQKAYRERQKQKLGAAWNEKEKIRRREYQVTVDEMNKDEIKKKRERDREYSKTYRRKLKSQKKESIRVKMPFVRHGTETSSIARKARRSRALKSANRRISHLQVQKNGYKRKFERLAKKVKRTEKKRRPTGNVNLTLRSRADEDLLDAGITPSSQNAKIVRKKLIFGNAMTAEVKETLNEGNRKETVAKVIAGKIMSKYRMNQKLSKETGISKYELRKKLGKSLKGTRKARRLAYKSDMEKKVVEAFYYRDDNSRMFSGKRDVKNGRQKRSLNDYLKHLYTKCTGENPNNKVSFSTFAKLRPREIVTVSHSRRDVCLCQKHQNMALKLRVLNASGFKVSLNPDEFARTEPTAVLVTKIEESQVAEIKFSEWQFEKVEYSGHVTRKMTLVEKTVTKQDFVNSLAQEVDHFKGHVSRVTNQYRENNRLKTVLPQGHVIAQMDYAENYVCKNLEEVQSAYWGQTSVTIHPVVIHYRVESTPELATKFYVVISDDHNHNANAVFTFLDKLHPIIKSDVGDVQHVHYWTDSPTSQYRNKTMFDVVSCHESLFSCRASWNYFEAGHGKGPSDGVGEQLKGSPTKR